MVKRFHQLEAFKHGGKQSSIKIDYLATLNLRSTEGTIHKVNIVLLRGERKIALGPYVVKRFKYGLRHSVPLIDMFVDNHCLLKKNGFPVAETVRRTKGENAVLITDLSCGGKKTVFSVNEIYLGIVADSVNLISNVDELWCNLLEIAQKAEQLNIGISPDIYLLLSMKIKKHLLCWEIWGLVYLGQLVK